MTMRVDGRKPDQMRPLRFYPDASAYAEGSVLVEIGKTRVLCTASLAQGIPKWLQGTEKGWIRGEYGMLPRSTHERIQREKTASSGRALEISRFIGRSLRSMVDLYQLGERQIIVDCDVLQADGGTRTASINGGALALALALDYLVQKGELRKNPQRHLVSAISLGLLDSEALLDLCYIEDSGARADLNFVMAQGESFVEIQGTGESETFSREELNQLTDLATGACGEIYHHQKKFLADRGVL